MTGARPRSEAIPSWVITVVLALLAAQSAYYNFNSTTTADIAVLKNNVEKHDRELDRLRGEIRAIELRRERDGHQR